MCSECGARNPAEVAWCGQCFASLAADDQPPQGQSAPAQSTEDGVSHAVAVETDETMPTGEAGSTGEGAGWVCTMCETFNPLEAQQCAACGTSIYKSFGAEDDERPDADPQKALMRSIMFPGLGHTYAGQGLLGAALVGLTLMALGFGIALVASGRIGLGWPLILLAIVIWVAAALDSVRIARGDTEGMVLRPRVVTALVGIVMAVLIIGALTAQGSAQ